MSQPPFTAPSLVFMNSILPAFEFSEIVQTDGLGAVYFAHQKSLDRQVAVKVFPPTLGDNPAYLQSFEKISNAVAALTHPNLIRIFDFGSVDGMLYLIMEFVPGKSLARSTRGDSIEFSQALSIIEGICGGLGFAHAKGIVHGNLDPSNILLNRQAEPNVGNFGFNRPDDAGASPYVAPELLAGSAIATMRSDVFSVATIFRELLTGSPIPGISENGEKFASLLKRATDPDPSKRMSNVQAFHAALKAAVAGGKPKPIPQGAVNVSVISVASPPDKKAATVKSVGFDWGLVVKLLIIVALLFAVNLAWKNLKSTEASREKENREVLAKDKAKIRKML